MMKKILYLLGALAMLSSCSIHREVADQTYDSGWIRYQCGLYHPNFDQTPSKTVASILKEVNGVYYCSEDVKIGKYEMELKRITDNFFKVKDRDLYLELRDCLPNVTDYHGLLEVKPVKMQHPWKENKLYNTTVEFFHLAPTKDY